MKIIKISSKNPDQRAIQKAAEILKKGGLVVYPTDTAYGLGGNALDVNAIKKVYETKGRDFSKPTHVVVRDWEMIENLCETNAAAKKLYDKFMPGPLTLILTKRPKIPNTLTANLPTLGVRIPDSPITQSLSRLVNFPYTTPSANKSDGNTPYSINKVIKELGLSETPPRWPKDSSDGGKSLKTKVDLILDAGKLPKVLPSTIVDLTSEVPKILREGPIKEENIQKQLKD